MIESTLGEIKYLVFDLFFLLSHKRKALKSKFSARLNLNKIRIYIFRIPSYIFLLLNRKYLSNNLQNGLIDKNFEFYKFNVSINNETVAFIENILN